MRTRVSIFLTSLLLSVALLFGTVHNSYSETITISIEEDWEFSEEDNIIFSLIEKHCVSVFSANDSMIGICSGVVVAQDENNTYILTCKHCLSPTEEMLVENEFVVSIIASVDDDLALLTIRGRLEGKTPVRLSKYDPYIGETLYHLAYPDIYEAFKSKGEVFRKTKDHTYARLECISGCSGGGIFNRLGELEGILWGGFRDVSIFEPVSDIKRFLGIIEINVIEAQ